jgi:dipeptidyl aminopeptidase/acylaminoacyl peptidase
MRLLFFIFLGLLITRINAQSVLQIDQIMQGADFVGHLPSAPFWSEDSKHIYFRWNQDTLPDNEYFKYSLGTQPVRMSLEEIKNIPAPAGIYNPDFTKKVYDKNGDLFLLDLGTGSNLQITNTVTSENGAHFSADEKKVIYRSEDNFYSWSVQDGGITQLTQFKQGKEKKEEEQKGHKNWLERDQLEYFEVLRERRADSDFNKAQRDSLAAERPKEIYLGDDQLSNAVVSPDLQYIVYRVRKDGKEKNTVVPDYVTQSGYVTDLRARSKVGDEPDQYASFIYDRLADTIYQIETDKIPGIYDKPAFLQDYHQGSEAYVDTFTESREVIMHGPIFNSEGNLAVMIIRSLDNKDRWIMSLDLEDGTLQLIDRQHDEAWVGGPGIEGWNFSTGNIGFLADDRTLWYQSEETGYSHIYSYNFISGTKKALTEGSFEILDVQLSRDKQIFFIHASKENPYEVHFYHLAIANGSWSKITDEPGNHQAHISPDEKNLAILYSYSNKPTELYWMENKVNATTQKITHSTTADFEAYAWRDPEIIQFKARDSVMVPARLYEPEASKKNGAAVVFVHGAGYLHNVHRWWSSYFREFMFHNFLADQGYMVIDIDYRGSAGYGRDWRTAIYRFMGGQDLDDQVDGTKFLVENKAIDKNRIGIYGGSYGGFITLMALCTSPGTFKCGAALRSVTDWAHYNHGYTSNILNTPMQDSIAYFRSSPIYHAEGLQGDLLMLHGMVDRNVHFQDVVRMSQRFIELGKDNWELAVFPMEDHGFVEGSSWTDEYKRIYRLFEKNLR